MILWNAQLTRRLACTDEERSTLIAFIGDLVSLCGKVKSEGLKSLAESGGFSRTPMLEYGVRMILEGISGETLEEILAIYLTTSNFESVEFLKQCITTEALLSLASGDSCDIFLRKLAPYCGAHLATELLESLSQGGGRASV